MVVLPASGVPALTAASASVEPCDALSIKMMRAASDVPEAEVRRD